MNAVDKYHWKQYNRIAKRAGLKTLRFDEWDESLHEREANGQFAPKGGGDNSSSQATSEKPIESSSEKQTTFSTKTNSKYRNQRNALMKSLGKEDGTFDLETGERVEYDSGYQVAFQTSQSEEIDSDGYLDDARYDKFVKEISKKTGSKPHLGKFDEAEISFHCETREQAMEIAKEHNQHSILDWAKKKEYEDKGVEWWDDDKASAEVCPMNPFYDPTKNHVKGM